MTRNKTPASQEKCQYIPTIPTNAPCTPTMAANPSARIPLTNARLTGVEVGRCLRLGGIVLKTSVAATKGIATTKA